MKRRIKSARVTGRRLLVAILLPVIAISLLAPGDAQAVPTQGGGSVPSATQLGVRAAKQWHQLSSADDARTFFGANDSEDNLAYRALVGSDWQTPTGPPGSGNTAILNQDANLIHVQVFRKRKGQGPGEAFATKDDYTDPPSYNHATLTLVGGYHFSEDSKTAAFSDVTSSIGKTLPWNLVANQASSAVANGPSGFFTAPVTATWDAVTSPVSAVGALIGGKTQDAAWVFSGNGNGHVTNTLTCSHGKPDGSRFAFLDKQAEQDILGSNGSLDSATLDKYKIADINQTLQGGGIGFRRFDETSLAAYLCQNSNDTNTFAAFCKKMVSDDSRCVTDSRGLLDALSSLLPSFDPLGWALGILKTVVSGFIVLVADALQQITDIGNLASNSGVTAAWKVMRDLANVLFILVLGALAFSTILRIDTQKYGLRALLPRLIFIIIAVNFSLMFVTILVDVATTLSAPFLHRAMAVLTDLNPASNIDAFTQQASGTGQEIILLIAALVIAVVLVILLLFFIVRILMIWMLAALAPLALLLSVLPFSRSLAMQWLKQLLKWVFMAPIAFMILWIGAAFLSAADSLSGALLGSLIFVGVCIAAVLIPLKLGGEVMQRAAAPGSKLAKGGAGALARRTGVPAAMKQMRDASERRAAYRGAGLRERASGAMSKLSGGKLGTEGRIEAETQRSAALESEASNLEKQFPGDDLDRLDTELAKSGKPENNRMRQAVAMAKDIRSGAFEARRGGEKAAAAFRNFQLQGPEQQAAEIGALGERGVQQFPRQVLHGLVKQRSPLLQQLPEGALRGIVQQNDPEKVRSLREAHHEGLLDSDVVSEVQNWNPDDRARWDRLVLQRPQRGRGTQGPGGGQPGGGGGAGSTGGTGAAGEEAPKRIILPKEQRTKDEPPNPDDIRKP